jgi:hypothetical protein
MLSRIDGLDAGPGRRAAHDEEEDLEQAIVG